MTSITGFFFAEYMRGWGGALTVKKVSDFLPGGFTAVKMACLRGLLGIRPCLVTNIYLLYRRGGGASVAFFPETNAIAMYLESEKLDMPTPQEGRG